jgi:hypothetical protein
MVVPVQVMELDPPAEEHLMVLEQDQLEALQMETVVMELVQPAEEQVLVTEMVQTVGIPALVLMVVPVQVMALEAQKEHLMVLEQDQLVVDPQIAMAQVMAQLVAQVMVTETVQTVGTPAVVLLTAPEAQATVLVMAQDPVTQVGILEVA